MSIANRDLFQALKTQASLAQAFGTLPGSQDEPHALKPGEYIEAWHNGRLYHRGTVVKTVAGTELFWLQDETGSRRLLDMESMEIVTSEEPAPTPATQTPEPTRTATVTPISAFPLFTDGSQAIA
ncbi:hypothetical protein [Paenarthrobacter aurescens]|uniref:Uncharacterized protein n=1 Tax=Paenarthrobacter aurescens TaxID=43663 RepID=A0A4Y3ND03_PAEAU|nr:hypothetical protein [Paenarthrobacter aurescens]UKA50175.1 hypothetical protein LFT48_01130 [Arthrobacter sp. FW305-123]MDO6141902.1 hypothetical protein [Paenarthrobacter aurescens]MDO6145707.1 hypothetical protein [Paenarthrobacter aurescens]MDO6156951.1 hypothetical protein [Paenarthrobacter aurescens]MDO6160937.1 hypothetical protein [Paenarthrobacter aurescens]